MSLHWNLSASNWREKSDQLLEPRPVGNKDKWRTEVTNTVAKRAVPVLDLTEDTNDAKSAPGSPRSSENDAALAHKVTNFMDNFSQVNVQPQWRRRVSAGVKKKVKSIMDILTRVSGDEMSESEEEVEEEEVEPANKVEGLDVTLLPHQVEGLAWLLSREENKARGGILADDMGLGKTIQSIGLILSHPHPKFRLTPSAQNDATVRNPDSFARSTLIIAPLGLIKQWEGELKNRTTSLPRKIKVLVHHGPSRSKDKYVLEKHDVVITTYSIVASEFKNANLDNPSGLFAVRWWRIILDEAHSIKNPSAKGSQACFALRSRNRWCLTGTPIQNNLTELQSLIRFLRIAPYDEMPYFKDQIITPMKGGKEDLAMERLKLILAAILLRRTKKAIAEKEKNDKATLAASGGKNSKSSSGINMDLPERIIKTIICEFSPGERAFYDKLEDKTGKKIEEMAGKDLNYTHALVLLLRLRQACNHPQLLTGKIQDDTEALTAVKPSSSKKKKGAEKDVDDLADIMGGLSVENKKKDLDDLADIMGGLTVETKTCDICLETLSRAEVSKGAVRCKECSTDLQGFRKEKRRESLNALKAHEEKRKEKERRKREALEAERRQIERRKREREERKREEAARQVEQERARKGRLVKASDVAAPTANTHRRRVVRDSDDEESDAAPPPQPHRHRVAVDPEDDSEPEVTSYSRHRNSGTVEQPITLDSDEEFTQLSTPAKPRGSSRSPAARPRKRRDSFIDYDTDEEEDESEEDFDDDDDDGNRSGMFDSQAEESDGPESEGEFNQSMVSMGSQAGVSGDDSDDDDSALFEDSVLGDFIVPDDDEDDSRSSTRHLKLPSAAKSKRPSSRSCSTTHSKPSSRQPSPSPALPPGAQSELYPSTKITELLKILAKESHNKTIVFSQFTSMLDLIEPFLKKACVPYTRYDGSMPNPLREAALHRLKTEPVSECRVLLCSLKCGAVGLNLTAACRVVIVEPFWNPAIEEQAIDRVHRFGQTKDVVVYKLSVVESVEERVLQLQEEKRRLIEAAIGEGSMAAANKLGLREIMRLFKRAPKAGAHGSGSGTPRSVSGSGGGAGRVLPPSFGRR